MVSGNFILGFTTEKVLTGDIGVCPGNLEYVILERINCLGQTYGREV